MQETHHPEGTDGRRGVEGSLDGTTAAAPGRESLFARHGGQSPGPGRIDPLSARRLMSGWRGADRGFDQC